jgi:hypothetical protein
MVPITVLGQMSDSFFFWPTIRSRSTVDISVEPIVLGSEAVHGPQLTVTNNQNVPFRPGQMSVCIGTNLVHNEWSRNSMKFEI